MAALPRPAAESAATTTTITITTITTTTTTMATDDDDRQTAMAPPPLPRVTIQFCTQCKWLLRAAYYAQELLSTFGAALGEVALQPAAAGAFVVVLETAGRAPLVLWDRARDGGFPETKDLKRRVRDVVDPARHLGHVDARRGSSEEAAHADRGDGGDGVAKPPTATGGPAPACDDCAS